MTTILRSLKYVKYLSSLSRQCINHHRIPEYHKLNLCLSNHTLALNRYNRRNHRDIETVKNNTEATLNAIERQVKIMGSVHKDQVLRVINAIEVAGSIESYQAILLIRSTSFLYELSPEERIQMVKNVWDTLLAHDIPMDVSHYNALLSVHCDNNYEFSPLEFLLEMQTKGIMPNRVTYERLLKYYCQQGNVEGVTKIMEQMKEENIPLTENTFNNLIMGHSKAGDLDSAVKVLDLMQQANIEPGAETYAALMCAYAERGDIENIKRVLSDCESKEIAISNRHKLDVIYALCENHHLSQVNEILPLLSSKKEYPADELVMMSKLIEIGQENVAFKIFESFTSLSRASSLPFLTGKIVSTIESNETVLELLQTLHDIAGSSDVYLHALRASYKKADSLLSLSIMQTCKDKGIEIRTHYFWPLLIQNAKNYDYQGVLNVIQSMIEKFEIQPCIETIACYVLPFCMGPNHEILTWLKNQGTPQEVINDARLYHLLRDGKIRQAAAFVQQTPQMFFAEQLIHVLDRAFEKTKDFQSYAAVLSHLYSPKKKIWTVNSIPVTDTSDVIQLMHYFKQYGIRITLSLANTIKATSCHPEVDRIVEELLQRGIRTQYRKTDISEQSNDQEMKADEIIISKIQHSTDKNTVHKLYISLLYYYMTHENLEQTRELLSILRQKDVHLTLPTYHDLIRFFSRRNLTEEAVVYLQELKKHYPDVQLYPHQAIKYTTLLAKLNKFEDALQFLKSELKPQENPNNQDILEDLKSTSLALLNAFAEQENEELLETCFQTLYDCGVLKPSNSTTRPFLKKYLDRGDFQGALRRFLWTFNKYNTLPAKSTITKHFITLEDAKSLQILLDCGTQKMGETRALIELILDLLKCDRTRQAIKILETTQLKFRTDAWSFSIDRCYDPKVLENLIEVTRNMHSVPKTHIYGRLLSLYASANDWNKALDLWTKMQDNDILPNEQFLTTLAELLEQNGQNVPFVYTKKHPKETPINFKSKFETAVISGNLRVAEETLKKINPGHSKLMAYYDLLITQYLKKEDINKAAKIAKFGLTQNPKLSETSVFKELMDILADRGVTETLQDLQRMNQNSP